MKDDRGFRANRVWMAVRKRAPYSINFGNFRPGQI